MHPPSRARRILKWTGIGTSVLLLYGWVMFRFQAVQWWYSSPYQETAIGAWGGNIQFITYNNVVLLPFIPPPGWSTNHNMNVPPSWGFNWPVVELSKASRQLRLELPFWLVLLAITLPTAWLWHCDRRRIKPDCCLRCGYDLTSNTSGVCPECGDKACPPAVLAASECGKAMPPPPTV